MTIPTATAYAVIDRNGDEWARYCYMGMAIAVALRCNHEALDDASMAARAPFSAAPVASLTH